MEFTVNPAYVLSFLTRGVLYSRSYDVFLRELVQNSLDSITHRRALEKQSDYVGRIRIKYQDGTSHRPPAVIIVDNGLGLTPETIKQELLTPLTPFHHKSKAIDPRLEDVRGEFIGRYGMGLMTAFHVSDSIIVSTVSHEHSIGHQVAINLVWQSKGSDNEQEVEKLDVTYSKLTKHSFQDSGTEVLVWLKSANPANQERLEHVGPDTIRLGLDYYLRHIDPKIEIVFEYKGHKRLIQPKPYIAEQSLLSDYNRSQYMTISIGPRTTESENVGTVLCVRGILVSLDHPHLLDDIGRALVGEVDIHDSRLINLKPSREECSADSKFQALQKNVRKAQDGFNRCYRDYKKGVVGGQPTLHVPRHPMIGDIEEESESLQGYLKSYFLTQHEYVADMILRHVRFRLDAPVSGNRVSIEEIIKHCQTLGTRKVYFFYEEQFQVDYLCDVNSCKIWWQNARQFDAAVDVAQKRDVILRLRLDKTRYSIEPLIRFYLEERGLQLIEMPSSYGWLSRFMNAERALAMDLPFPVAGIRAGGHGRIVYAHREGLWLNTDLASTVLDKGRPHSEKLTRIALAFLACKFDAVENLLNDVLLKK